MSSDEEYTSDNIWSSKQEEKQLILRRNSFSEVCNCGWEVKFGHGVAVTLAIFETKRFFMLMLELFVEWQVIRFADGLRPVIFTLINVFVGFPAALISIYTIRKSVSSSGSYLTTKIHLKYILIIIAICILLNVGTIISIGYYISVRPETLANVFNASMNMYLSHTSYKLVIDEIQFIFQCCGHTSYLDWYSFDWQKTSGKDYSQKEGYFRRRSVPFSCCNLKSKEPCIHNDMTNVNVETINRSGCAKIISPALIRIVIVGYIMTITLVVTQALLIFLIIKMIESIHPKHNFVYSMDGSISDSSDCISSPDRYPSSSDEDTEAFLKNKHSRLKRVAFHFHRRDNRENNCQNYRYNKQSRFF